MGRSLMARSHVAFEVSFETAERTAAQAIGAIRIEPLTGGRIVQPSRSGTMFLLTTDVGHVDVEGLRFPVPAGGWAVLPSGATVAGGRGVAIVHEGHRGLFSVGGPCEARGRLSYIDGCTDTVLVSPVVRGDPCLNLLRLPPGVVQTDHDHPSVRVGLVLSGRGTCVLGSERAEMRAGVVFVLPAFTTHRFETAEEELRLIAWHPDSDFGPTDDDHPMLNRTYRAGTSDRVR